MQFLIVTLFSRESRNSVSSLHHSIELVGLRHIWSRVAVSRRKDEEHMWTPKEGSGNVTFLIPSNSL